MEQKFPLDLREAGFWAEFGCRILQHYRSSQGRRNRIVVIKVLSGKPQPDKNPKDMGPAELILYERYLRDEIKNMPFSLDDLEKPLSYDQIRKLPTVSVDIMNILLDVARRFERQIKQILSLETKQMIYQHLAGVEYFMVSEVDGWLPGTRLGLTQYQPQAIYLALRYQQKIRRVFRLSSTLCHELTHVANPFNDKLDPFKYRETFREVHRKLKIAPDPNTENIRESVPRAFQGTLFGTPGHQIALWHLRYQSVVELVLEDQATLFMPHPDLEENLIPDPTHTNSQSDILSPDPEIPGFFICYADEEVRPSIHSPLERGIYRWVREQAFRAAHDPDREWHGAVAEYLRLREGTHPDPDPGAIIFPNEPELYDPQHLEIDYTEMVWVDKFVAQTIQRLSENDGKSLTHRFQLEAAECCKELDEVISEQEYRVAERAEYDASHPEEVHASGDYW